jgi:hypothetical protein
MTDETGPSGGDAVWRHQRDEIAKRNADAHRRGQAERRAQERAVEARGRLRDAREAEELHELNAQIDKRRTGDSG